MFFIKTHKKTSHSNYERLKLVEPSDEPNLHLI